MTSNRRRLFLCRATFSILAAASTPALPEAAGGAQGQTEVDEVVVIGSRLSQAGYQAPTIISL